MSTLSVETSSSGSSTSTVSPTCLSQRVTVPSVTLSPSAGIFTAVPSPPTAPAAGAGAGAGRRLGLRPAPARRPRPAAGSRLGGRLGGLRLGGLGLRRRARRAAAGVLAVAGDDGQLAADLGGLVLADHDPGQHAGGGRRDLGVDLVGGDLEQRLVDLDASPSCLSQRVTVPSVTLSPSRGMVTDTGMCQ